MKVQELIIKLKGEGMSDKEIASYLGVSQPMVSAYKKGYKASYDVAKRVYKVSGITLFPFSEEGVQEQ